MKKNANLPALIFMFALLIVWQCIAMGKLCTASPLIS